MKMIIISFSLTILVITLGCNNNKKDWSNGYKVLPSDETISQDSLEILIKNLPAGDTLLTEN